MCLGAASSKSRQAGTGLFFLSRMIILAATASFLMDREASACVLDPPVDRVQGVDYYLDKHASIVDAERQQADAKAYRPVQMFVYHLEQIIDADAPSSELISCALQNLHSWALSDAMLTQPENFPGVRQRARFSVALNVIALKLKVAGYSIDEPITRWLHTLAQKAVADFSTRKPYSNLYIWSGVNAASDAILTGDKASRLYATNVWRLGVSQINADGTIDVEMDRASRALMYHQYYLAGLLMLRSFRVALGDQATHGEDAKLRILAKVVGNALCDPTSLGELAHASDQERPPPYQFAVPTAFGQDFLDAEWGRCGKIPSQLIDSGAGGDMAKAALALEALRRK
ncbi:alginate lyase family protein [Methylocystis parvus]|nr:alginate lyase family protein [Methylocystis parvus]WBK02075.1 alginate lyase family protein [Methylocystis parvus OBBP]